MGYKNTKFISRVGKVEVTTQGSVWWASIRIINQLFSFIEKHNIHMGFENNKLSPIDVMFSGIQWAS
jgi:hypothetical protein